MGARDDLLLEYILPYGSQLMMLYPFLVPTDTQLDTQRQYDISYRFYDEEIPGASHLKS
jgi:hypothetical protein